MIQQARPCFTASRLHGFTASRLHGFIAGALLTTCAFAADAEESALTAAQAEEIRARIATLHANQAEYHRKVAAGEILPGEDLRKQWPQLVEQLAVIHREIHSLNALDASSPQRPALEEKLLGSLQQIGIHLETASHPPFAPRVLSEQDLAEMRRIETAIAALEFGDRSQAAPLTALSPDPAFTLIHLPVPIVLQGRPGESIYLAATTGGAFANGLSLIELKTDDQGLAKTTWTSIGDAVGDCDISVHSATAIETRHLRIRVLSPSIPVPEGLPNPEHLQGEIPRLQSKVITTKTQASPLTD